jgi:hypothetical protein
MVRWTLVGLFPQEVLIPIEPEKRRKPIIPLSVDAGGHSTTEGRERSLVNSDKKRKRNTMNAKNRCWRRLCATGAACGLLATALALIAPGSPARAGTFFERLRHCCGWDSFAGCGEEPPCLEVGGAWYWLHSPEEEKRVVMGLYNRYCIRCHGVDGRGVWDIPDVPNFTNAVWQSTHTDGQLARSILEGRGSVMPPWRGTLSLEEAWGMARYIRTFIPGTEVARPDVSGGERKPPAELPPPAPKGSPPRP